MKLFDTVLNFVRNRAALTAALLATACALALLAGPAGLQHNMAQAATTNIGVATPGVQIVPLQLSGQYTTNTTAVVRFQLPFPARVLGVSASARASGGTTPTLTVDVLDDGTSILDSAVSVTAGSVAEATLDSTKVSIADESVITVDLAIGGSSPTWDDITVLITIVRT